MSFLARGSPWRELATLPPMKYSHPRSSSTAATRRATSSALATSVELPMSSHRVVRHVAEQPSALGERSPGPFPVVRCDPSR